MTTTVYVKARAHGALVTLRNIEEGEPTEFKGEMVPMGHVVQEDEQYMAPWSEREIHLERNQQVVVREGSPELVAAQEAEAAAARQSSTQDTQTVGAGDIGDLAATLSGVDENKDGRDDRTGQFVPGENHPASKYSKKHPRA